MKIKREEMECDLLKKGKIEEMMFMSGFVCESIVRKGRGIECFKIDEYFERRI
jgi:hypothetical protein